MYPRRGEEEEGEGKESVRADGVGYSQVLYRQFDESSHAMCKYLVHHHHAGVPNRKSKGFYEDMT